MANLNNLFVILSKYKAFTRFTRYNYYVLDCEGLASSCPVYVNLLLVTNNSSLTVVLQKCSHKQNLFLIHEAFNGR